MVDADRASGQNRIASVVCPKTSASSWLLLLLLLRLRLLQCYSFSSCYSGHLCYSCYSQKNFYYLSLREAFTPRSFHTQQAFTPSTQETFAQRIFYTQQAFIHRYSKLLFTDRSYGRPACRRQLTQLNRAASSVATRSFIPIPGPRCCFRWSLPIVKDLTSCGFRMTLPLTHL